MNIIKILLLIIGLGLLSNFSHGKSLKAAPDFMIDEKTKLSQLKGKVVYLDFWASWCGPCRKSFPWMNQLTEKYDPEKFVLLSVNLDSEKAQASKFLAKYPARFSITYDPEGKIAEKYQVMGMPSSYLIDAQGRIAATHVGFFKKKIAKYEKQIDYLLKQK